MKWVLPSIHYDASQIVASQMAVLAIWNVLLSSWWLIIKKFLSDLNPTKVVTHDNGNIGLPDTKLCFYLIFPSTMRQRAQNSGFLKDLT